MTKYTPLQTYLAGLPTGTQSKTITFAQIEKILNSKLPPSAYEYLAWWANEVEGRHVEARSWLNAGWKVGTVNLPAGWVRFARIGNMPQKMVGAELPDDISQIVDQGISDAINGQIKYLPAEAYKTELLSFWGPIPRVTEFELGIPEKKDSYSEKQIPPQEDLPDWLQESAPSIIPPALSEEDKFAEFEPFIPETKGKKPKKRLKQKKVSPDRLQAPQHSEIISDLEEDESAGEIPRRLLNESRPAYYPQAQAPAPRSRYPASPKYEQPEEYDIGMSDDFIRSISKIDANLRGRILDAIGHLSRRPITPQGDTVKPLVGEKRGLWRYRIAGYRLIYQPDLRNHHVTILAFASRGSVYE